MGVNMKNIRVLYKNKIYHIISKKEAYYKISKYDWPKIYLNRQNTIVYLNLRTGEICSQIYTNNTCYLLCFPFLLLDDISEFAVDDIKPENLLKYKEDFSEFQMEYEDRKNNIKRDYRFDFTCEKYENVYQAYVYEVMGETWSSYIYNYQDCLYDYVEGYLDSMDNHEGEEAICNFYNSLKESANKDYDFIYYEIHNFVHHQN